MAAGTEGTPAEGVRARSSAPPLALMEIFRGALTTLHVQKPRTSEGRPVVRKHLSDEHAGDTQLQHVFQAAGHLAMRVNSSHVVRTLAVKGNPDGFMAIDYVQGAPLSELLENSRGRDVTRFVVPILLDVLAGLQALHDLRGEGGEPTPVVHQAPSARHIVVGLDGRARLCDLMHIAGPGLAPSSERQRFLRPEEMSPEQASGTGHIDSRCDLFIVGTVLWEALTGERLFLSNSPQDTLARVLRMPIGAPSQRGTSSFFDTVCAKALMRVRVGRYGSPDEMAEDLREAAVPRGLCASEDEVADWVRSSLLGSSRESQTLLKPASSSTPIAPLASSSESSVVKATPRGLRAVALPASDTTGEHAHDVSDSEVFESTGPFSMEGAATRARPALSEQLATGMQRARERLGNDAPRAASGSDSMPVPTFHADRDSEYPDREDPTRPRVISAVFGGPMPSVLSDAPAWVEEVVHGGPEPRRLEPRRADLTLRPRSGWLRGALLGAAIVVVIGALVLRFGGFDSALQIVGSKPKQDTPTQAQEARKKSVPDPTGKGEATRSQPTAAEGAIGLPQAADTPPAESDSSHTSTTRHMPSGAGTSGVRPAAHPGPARTRETSAPHPGVPENPY